ncbi:7168_t:CDS:2 [Cetraspora pellucida]|uniref:7168_t:CDS:1 n=1 Tax=Cetraspora pellucida TaxID=1433469 RepID=A0ACA9N354_9GLOM|nr:7168_t:CDS:2 [Cetraspora pellucida]
MKTSEGSSKELNKKKPKKKSLTSAQKAEICYLRQKVISQVKLVKKFKVAKATILVSSAEESTGPLGIASKYSTTDSADTYYKKIFYEDRIDVFDTFLKFGNPPELINIKDAIDIVTIA